MLKCWLGLHDFENKNNVISCPCGVEVDSKGKVIKNQILFRKQKLTTLLFPAITFLGLIIWIAI